MLKKKDCVTLSSTGDFTAQKKSPLKGGKTTFMDLFSSSATKVVKSQELGLIYRQKTVRNRNYKKFAWLLAWFLFETNQWYLYNMVVKNTLRAGKGKQVFSKNKFQIYFDQNNYL